MSYRLAYWIMAGLLLAAPVLVAGPTVAQDDDCEEVCVESEDACLETCDEADDLQGCEDRCQSIADSCLQGCE